ncbi:MAG: hypothetical protein AAGK66_07865 [Pseudomonadota bacterium]
MKNLMMGAAALALIAGCGGTGGDTPSTSDADLSKLTVRDGDPAKAADALAAMSLTDSGSGILFFADKSVDGDDATFTNLTIGGSDEMKIGSLAFEGLNVEGDTATFGKMVFSDIEIAPPGEEGTVKVGDISLVNPSPELSGWLAATLSGQQRPFPAVETLEFGSASISDITGAFDDADAAGTFGLGKFEIRDMTDLKAARFLMKGLTFDAEDATEGMSFTGKIDEMSMVNVDAKYLKAIEDNIGDEEEMVAAVMALAYENPMEPGYDSFAMEGLDLNLAGAKVAMDSLSTFVERNANGDPVKYVTPKFTMKIDADPDGGEGGVGLLQGLSVLGYENLVINGEGVADYNPDSDVVSYTASKNYFEVEDGARFSFGGELGGFAEYSKLAGESFNFEDLANGAEPDPDAMTEAFSALTIFDLSMEIKDDGLVNRSINAAATMNGQDPDALRSQISMGLGMAPMMAQGSGVDMALVTEVTGALSKFIADPGTLTISMKPGTPLNLGTAMANPDPASFTKDSLGITASAK